MHQGIWIDSVISSDTFSFYAVWVFLYLYAIANYLVNVFSQC